MAFSGTVPADDDDPQSRFASAKVLVAGGCGLIGSWLAARMVEWGAAVTIVDSLDPRFGGNPRNIARIRDHANLVIADIRDANVVERLVRHKDYIFNVAGQSGHVGSMSDPILDLEINAKASLTLLESCRKFNADVKIVFASTRQVYGVPSYLPVDEVHPLDPVDINGINKLAAERYHLLFSKLYGLRVAILRMTNTYGAGMRIKDARQMFLGIWIRRVLEDAAFSVFGDGTQLRDFNHVADVVDAMARCAASARTNGQIYNLGGDSGISLTGLADLLVAVAGRGRYSFVPFPAEQERIDIGSYVGNYLKIKEAVGWRPGVSLDVGITDTLEYYSKFGGHYLDG